MASYAPKQSIPRICHRIWFGSELPTSYQENIVTLARLNPGYTVKLLSDSKTMTSEQWATLSEFCTLSGIDLSDVRTAESLVNTDLILKELDASLERSTQYEKVLNYVRASDLARISLILRDGGIYTDTEIKPYAGFGQLYAEYGFLEVKYGDLRTYLEGKTTEGVPYPYFISNQYDCLAGVPGNPLHLLASRINQLDYDSLSKIPDAERLLYSQGKIMNDSKNII